MVNENRGKESKLMFETWLAGRDFAAMEDVMEDTDESVPYEDL